MPGRSSDSTFGRSIGVLVAAIAVGLLALDRFTSLAVPYGYGGDLFPPGLAIAVVVVVGAAWRYRDSLPPR